VVKADVPGPALPIDAVFDEVRQGLAECNRLVLVAPPGAGKSTRVPLALLSTAWLQARKIVVLEPRRLAARAVARRMAYLLSEPVGETVGYRMRGDTRVGQRTRIEVVTEGVLTRMLLRDATLDGYGVILFDEFHERSIHADFGLALALQSQELLRPELRIVLMSATMDVENVAPVLGSAPVVQSESRHFPIQVRHVAVSREMRLEGAVAATVRRVLTEHEGSVLAFLPGSGEIRRCLALLEEGALPADVVIHPLYGDLAPEQQDAAVLPPARGQRKVVLATSIAETSLTIEGVRVVVDSGYSRVSRFSPRLGMSRLETIRVSRASAHQRTGRAGREGPGYSYRLWSDVEDASLAERSRAEILDADLAPLALDLAAVGVIDVGELRWIDAPPDVPLRQARALLGQLGLVDTALRITSHGRDVAALGVHPRLGHMLVTARALGFGATACVVAALLEERDVLRRGDDARDPDLRLRFDLVMDPARAGHARGVRTRIQSLRGALGLSGEQRPDANALGHAVALAYPERVAQQRSRQGRYRLRNGIGAVLPAHSALWREEFLAIAEVDGRSPDAAIFLAAPLDRAVLFQAFDGEIERSDVIEWSAAEGSVTTRRQELLGAVVLRDVRVADAPPDRVASVLLDAILRGDGVALSWSDAALRLRQRVAFLRAYDQRWPDWSDDALHAAAHDWLLPHLAGVRRRIDVERLPLHDILMESLSWEQRRDLERFAPTHVVVPTGSRIPVSYDDAAAPRIAVRLQELFGLEKSPVVGPTGVAVTIELLSPAHRPVQVTTDLAGFWRSSYHDVRKEMRGRYPRHEWPEDPLSATPTRRAKRRGE
jgi:ATP-dependent helicase HrpB